MNRVEFKVVRKAFHLSMEGYDATSGSKIMQLVFAEENNAEFGNENPKVRSESETDEIGMLYFRQGPMVNSSRFNVGAIASGVFYGRSVYINRIGYVWQQVARLQLSADFIYDVYLINHTCTTKKVDVTASVSFQQASVPPKEDPLYSSVLTSVALNALDLVKIPTSPMPAAIPYAKDTETYLIEDDSRPELIGLVKVKFFSWDLKLAAPPTEEGAALPSPLAAFDVRLRADCATIDEIVPPDTPGVPKSDR